MQTHLRHSWWKRNVAQHPENQKGHTVRLTVDDLVPLHAQRRVRRGRRLGDPGRRYLHLQRTVGALPTRITEAFVHISADLEGGQSPRDQSLFARNTGQGPLTPLPEQSLSLAFDGHLV